MRSKRPVLPLRHRLSHLPLFGLVFLLFAFSPPAQALVGHFVLVDNGRNPAPIILFKDAPPKTTRAAQELADFIERISGARPQVFEGSPSPVPSRAIWIGDQPEVRELFPAIDFDFQHPEEILIAATPQHLVVAGRDRWDPDFLVVPGRNWTINGRQQEYGTINAVYTFLQQFLNVRWLFPGEIGVDIIAAPTIRFAPFTYRYHPQFLLRSNLFRLSDLGDSRGLAGEWTRFQRLQLDSLRMPTGGHVYDFWWKRFHETNPEFFALQPDGTRSGFPSPTLVKRCKSNPEVWRQWVDDVEDTLRTDPTQRVFMSGINDSYNRGHCVCSDCTAWDHPEGEMFRYSWQGLSQEYVALSDRHATFYNKLARELKQRFPDRDDLRVSGGAYGNWRSAPVAVELDENVIIPVVANFFLREGEMRDQHRQWFADWSKKAKYLTWRPNTGPSVGWRAGFPDVPFHLVMEDFRFVADHKCIGLAFDTVWEHWSTQGPVYYLMAQLAWNPYADGDAILNDYFTRAYGPAANTMTKYWKLMETTRNEHVASRLPFTRVYETYDDTFFSQAKELLDSASKRVANAPEIYRLRLEYVASGLEYTRLAVDSAELMTRYRNSRGADTKAADEIRANFERIEEIRKLQPLGMRYNTAISNIQTFHPDSVSF